MPWRYAQHGGAQRPQTATIRRALMSIQNHIAWERAATGDSDSLESLSIMCARKSIGEEDLAACVEFLEGNFQKLSKNARLNLGTLHVNLGNPERYFHLLKMNMNDKHVLSCHRLGKCYEYGIGCEVNLDLAAAYYSDSAREGHVIARARLLKVKTQGWWTSARIFILISYILVNIVPAVIYIFIRDLLKFRRTINWRIKD